VDAIESRNPFVIRRVRGVRDAIVRFPEDPFFTWKVATHGYDKLFLRFSSETGFNRGWVNRRGDENDGVRARRLVRFEEEERRLREREETRSRIILNRTHIGSISGDALAIVEHTLRNV